MNTVKSLKDGLFTVCLLLIIASTVASSFDGLLFKPTVAGIFEPRVGASYLVQTEKLRLDIGHSADLTDFIIDDGAEIRIGADFFTYTRLRSENNFKFPVETSDYFFGVNSSCKLGTDFGDLSLRLRASHISSHLVDGFAKDSVFRQLPFVYSREFVDLLVAFEINQFRLYAGSNYIFSTKPKNFEPFNPQIGFDIITEVFSPVYFLAGYDFRLVGIDKVYTGVNSAQAGFLFNTGQNAGVFIGAFYYSGKSMHGMFYNEYDSYAGLGFQVYFK